MQQFFFWVEGGVFFLVALALALAALVLWFVAGCVQ